MTGTLLFIGGFVAGVTCSAIVVLWLDRSDIECEYDDLMKAIEQRAGINNEE